MLGKLIKANFRKDFSQMISFLLIVILSSTMLGCGLTLLLGYNDDYETKLAANNSAHVRMHVVGSKDHRDELTDIERYLASSPCVEDYVTVDGLMATTSIDQSDNDDDVKDLMESAEYTALFTPLDEDRDIERMNFIEKSDEEYDNPIYISGYVSYNSSRSFSCNCTVFYTMKFSALVILNQVYSRTCYIYFIF